MYWYISDSGFDKGEVSHLISHYKLLQNWTKNTRSCFVSHPLESLPRTTFQTWLPGNEAKQVAAVSLLRQTETTVSRPLRKLELME